MFSYFTKIQKVNDIITATYTKHHQAKFADWYVTELVDGQHLALYANHSTNEFQVANRARFLDLAHEEDRDYACIDAIIPLYKEAMMQLSKRKRSPITFFGVVTGGRYAGTYKGTVIDTVCDYMDYNDFIIHDVKIASSYLGIMALEKLAQDAVLNIAPVLYKGKLQEAYCYPENLLSAVPFMSQFDMPIVFNNEMKGVVIRPSYDITIDNRRAIIKKINPKYLTSDVVIVSNATLMEIANYIDGEAEKLGVMSAVINAIGNVGYGQVDKVAGRYVSTAVDKVSYIKYTLLEKKQRKVVNKELSKLAKDKLLAILRAA